ncbi:MAG: TetR/AcrR family transcriptional regulator [Gaiellaceae bacterium]
MMLRADAQRNLDRLLGAAAECFAEQGVDASVDEIARRAGVGHGTVFRRFPTKDALLAAVLAARMSELATVAEAACAEPDEGEAFDAFVHAAADAYARNRALIEAMKRCETTPEVGALVDAVARLLRRVQDAGVVRKDVTAEDVLALIPTASNYPDIVLDGLRPPGRPS